MTLYYESCDLFKPRFTDKEVILEKVRKGIECESEFSVINLSFKKFEQNEDTFKFHGFVKMKFEIKVDRFFAGEAITDSDTIRLTKQKYGTRDESYLVAPSCMNY